MRAPALENGLSRRTTPTGISTQYNSPGPELQTGPSPTSARAATATVVTLIASPPITLSRLLRCVVRAGRTEPHWGRLPARLPRCAKSARACAALPRCGCRRSDTMALVWPDTLRRIRLPSGPEPRLITPPPQPGLSLLASADAGIVPPAFCA